MRHFLPELPRQIRGLPDRRDPKQLYYPRPMLVWSAIKMLLLGLGSRRQWRYESESPTFVANLNAVAETCVETAPHDDTIAYYLERLPPEPFEELPAAVAERLLRMKALDRWRVLSAHLVAVDGTGQLFLRKRHCPYCLTQKAPNGETLYFHHVLEAKLATANGSAFSLATEFIENRDPAASKQDCELKALPRLLAKLRARYPRLPILLLLDALYANEPIFALCQKHHWHFLIVLKEGSLPSVYEEFYRILPERSEPTPVRLETS